MKKSITFITTIDHNIGDDFVREGLKYLFKNIYQNDQLNFHYIHKHTPITVRKYFDKVRSLKISEFLDSKLPQNLTYDKILNADIVVQSGAPVYWCHEETHCANNEWYKPLIEKRFKTKNHKVLLNIAAGTCQKYHSNGSEFKNCSVCRDYITDFDKQTALTTVRDRLAREVLGYYGLEAALIPCTSLFAIDEYNIRSDGEEYVILNFMERGGHYSFGQNIDYNGWLTNLKKIYNYIKTREKVVFVCHNREEIINARSIDPNANIFYNKNFVEYMRFYSKAKYGILNRVHGAFILASLGKPSLVVGNDSRARMTKEIELDNIFINDASYEKLINGYEKLVDIKEEYKKTSKEIKFQALNEYTRLFKSVLQVI